MRIRHQNIIMVVLLVLALHLPVAAAHPILSDVQGDDVKRVTFWLNSFKELLSQRDDNGNTLLHLAVNDGSLEMVTALLAYHPDVSAKNYEGDTPLHMAARLPEEAIAKLLLDHHAMVDARNHKGETPLFRAVESGRTITTTINESAKEGEPFFLRVEVGRTSLVQLLLELGADVQAKNDEGASPIHLVNSVEMLQCLLANGAQLNATDERGQTPLHYAVHQGTPALIEAIIAKGADLTARDQYGRTPLHVASFYGNAVAVKALLAHGANINARSQPHGYTALTYACMTSEVALCTTLIEAGADVTVTAADGSSLLHILAEHSPNGQLLSLLLSKGVAVNGVNTFGNTALHIAVLYGNIDLARLLLAKKANPNAANSIGMTPLHLAVQGFSFREGNLPLVKLLLEHKANPLLKNRDGETSLQLAKEANDTALTALLQKAAKGPAKTKAK